MRGVLKLVVVGVLVLALMIPLLMLHGLVEERQARGREVAEEIARSAAGPQRLVGPLLVVEAEVWAPVPRKDAGWDGAEGTAPPGSELRATGRTQRYLVSPQRLEAEGALRVERRGRSLFQVPLFHLEGRLQGAFEHQLPALPTGELRPRRAWLAVGLGDSRGLRAQQLRVDGQVLAPAPGTPLAWLPEGFHAEVPLDALAGPIAFELALELAGTESLDFVPAGTETRLQLSGDWPHPGFGGRHLPVDSEIGDAGFQARWALSGLSSRVPAALAACSPEEPRCDGLEAGPIGLRLVDPVDRYLMTERAMKYALLFLVLVFGAVFLVEALASVPVHVVQYGLTGLGLGMFYLLLLSLSEHLGFGLAYALAALACAGLLAYYLAGVLGGRGRGLGFGAGLLALYAVLYALLRAEDHALLVGSGLLFAALAAVMVLTRRVDWQRLGA